MTKLCIETYVHARRTVGAVTGVGKFIASAPLALQRLGHDVRLLVPHDEWRHETSLRTLPHTILAHKRRTIEWSGAVFGWPKLNVQADWVWCPAESFVAVRGTRLAITAHTSDWAESNLPWTNEWRYRRLRARWQLFYRIIRRERVRILAVSDFLKERLIDQVGVSASQITVVGHGVEDIYFRDDRSKLLRSFAEFQPYVLVVGGLSDYKGGDRVLAVARLLSHVKFLIVGDDDQRSELPPNVVPLGYRSAQGDLPDLYAQAVAVVCLSRYETFGLPVAEAMASGVPIIASNAGALPEVVGEAGWIVDGDKSAAFVGLINDLIRDEATRLQRAEHGRARAQEFRWNKTGQRIADALTN